MNRSVVAAALLVLTPMRALAQTDEPSECTTTTTVRCTGAAARYGAPPAAVPQPVVAPPPVVVLPPPMPYAYPPPLNPYTLKLADDWKVVQHDDGTWWQERKSSTASPGLYGTGLGLFILSWMGSGISSVSRQDTVGPVGFVPVLGAWINAYNAGHRYCDYGCGDTTAATALWALGGVVQATGFVMFLVGLSSGPAKIERRPLIFAPVGYAGGGGVAASGQF